MNSGMAELENRRADQVAGTALARLVEASLEAGQRWGPADYAAIFNHQLGCPIRDALPGLPAERFAVVKDWCERRCPPVVSLGDLLADPAPSARVLRTVKAWAKRSGAGEDGVLPHEVADVLYHLCIAVAFAKCGERVSRLDTSQMKAGFEWALRRCWVPSGIHDLFRAGLRTLEARS